MNTTLSKTAFVGCVGLATALPAFGEAYSLLEIPPERSTKEAFEKFSRPLEEVDKERYEQLRALGYKETFRVISFDTICEGLGKERKDFEAVVKDHGKILEKYIKSNPFPFCFCDLDGKVYNIDLPQGVIKNQKAALLAGLTGFEWMKKQKQLLAMYVSLLANKTSLKLIGGLLNGGFTYITEKDGNFRYVIHMSNASIQMPNMTIYTLVHEMRHALYYELGISGDPGLCTYTTKFMKDVYQITSDGRFQPVPGNQRTTKAIYEQCPDVVGDWHSIEEAWQVLGFFEIDGTVYINELSDTALPYNGTFSADAKSEVFTYRIPSLNMWSYIASNNDRWCTWLDRQSSLVSKDFRINGWNDFDKKDVNNEKGSRYLEAISVALNILPLDNIKQANKRAETRDFVQTRKEWFRKYLELGGNDGMSSEK